MNKSGGYRQRVGKEGEETAARYLENKGYFIVERNFRSIHGEIDIIAKDGQMLVFVEVKTNIRGGFGNPEERVDYKKQVKLGQVAAEYLQTSGLENIDCRFDVVAVSRTGGKTKIKHIEDAFWLDSESSEKLF